MYSERDQGLSASRCDPIQSLGLCNSKLALPQDLLDEPNPGSPAQSTAYEMYIRDKPQHQERVRKQALLYPPPF